MSPRVHGQKGRDLGLRKIAPECTSLFLGFEEKTCMRPTFVFYAVIYDRL